MTDKPEANVINHNGITFFRNTVAGMVDETGNLITVGNLLCDLGARIAEKDTKIKNEEERNAELADALRTLIDECIEASKELAASAPFPTAFDNAIENALTTLSGN